MGLLFYYFTICMMLVCNVAAAVSLSAFVVSHKRGFVCQMAFFAFYFVDLTLIFQYEYLGQNVPFSFEHFYAINYPVTRTLMALGSLESLWLLLCEYFDEHGLALRVIPALIFCGSSLGVVWLLPEGPLTQWVFYTLRQVFLLWCVAFCAWHYLRSTNEVDRPRMRRHLPLFVIVCVFIAIIAVEDYLMIMVWVPDPNAAGAELLLYISERNFSENVLAIIFAAFTLREAIATLRLRFERPPMAEGGAQRSHIEDVLPAYARRHGLTEREKEVLTLVLQGKDYRSIASELYLAVGTVKAHVHHILAKTDQPTRTDLIRDFWSE